MSSGISIEGCGSNLMEEFEQLGGWSHSQFREEKRVGTGFRGWGLLGSGG